MLLGHYDKVGIFKRLVEEERLAHGYIFFGEAEVGKCHFASALANFLETGTFDKAESVLRETLLVTPVDGNIGIDAMREAKRFLNQKPISAPRRTAIVDQAEALTPQAQNAVLKLAEEPPAHGLIVLVTSGLESLLPTLRSRLQQVYFPRVAEKDVLKLLEQTLGITPARAATLAKLALGRPGRAVALVTDEQTKRINQLAQDFLKSKRTKRTIIDTLLKEELAMEVFLAQIIAELVQDPLRHHRALDEALDRLTKMFDFTTNKRLQAEAGLWNI